MLEVHQSSPVHWSTVQVLHLSRLPALSGEIQGEELRILLLFSHTVKVLIFARNKIVRFCV